MINGLILCEKGVSIAGSQSSTTDGALPEKTRGTGLQTTSSTTASESTTLTGSAGEKGDLTAQAKGMFGQVTSAVQVSQGFQTHLDIDEMVRLEYVHSAYSDYRREDG